MVLWRRAHRQWKRSAEEAVSPVRFGSERDRLATKIAKQLWAQHGGRQWAEARDESAFLLLETMIGRYLTDQCVKTFLAWSYLELLQEAVARADYEDVGSLHAEMQWAAKFLSPALDVSPSGIDAVFSLRQAATVRLAAMEQSLAALVKADLNRYGVAA